MSESLPTQLPEKPKVETKNSDAQQEINKSVDNQLKGGLLSIDEAKKIRVMSFTSAITYLSANETRHDMTEVQLKRGNLTKNEAINLYAMPVYEAVKILVKNEIEFRKNSEK